MNKLLEKSNIFFWFIGSLIIIFIISLSCASENTPEYVEDLTKCKISAYQICGNQDGQSPCIVAARRECLRWAGYHIKKGKLVKTNNCDAAK